MEVPENLYYTREHEWVRVEDNNTVTVGITDYAQSSLGEIVYVELPDIDLELEKNDTLGSVESSKTASDIYSPISGKVIDINQILNDSPGLINEDPYGEGWLVRMQIFDISELEDLMSSDEYFEFVHSLIEEDET